MADNYGAGHPRAKLDAGKVRDMRDRHQAGESVSKLAKEYGVAVSVAWYAINRKTWKSVA